MLPLEGHVDVNHSAVVLPEHKFVKGHALPLPFREVGRGILEIFAVFLGFNTGMQVLSCTNGCNKDVSKAWM